LRIVISKRRFGSFVCIRRRRRRRRRRKSRKRERKRRKIPIAV
jgi:hypothetical protein